eukprot:6211046-Pleurochrysis_carterae.AAC.2
MQMCMPDCFVRRAAVNLGWRTSAAFASCVGCAMRSCGAADGASVVVAFAVHTSDEELFASELQREASLALGRPTSSVQVSHVQSMSAARLQALKRSETLYARLSKAETQLGSQINMQCSVLISRNAVVVQASRDRQQVKELMEFLAELVPQFTETELHSSLGLLRAEYNGDLLLQFMQRATAAVIEEGDVAASLVAGTLSRVQSPIVPVNYVHAAETGARLLRGASWGKLDDTARQLALRVFAEGSDRQLAAVAN